ncbi:MAG: hypothetical protein KC731_38425 [Myxococcales bacterium]|nr:hypothetical protein [Myxococcales bacterium]
MTRKKQLLVLPLLSLLAMLVAACVVDDEDPDDPDAVIDHELPDETPLQSTYCNSCTASCWFGVGPRRHEGQIDIGGGTTPSQCADLAAKKCGDALIRWSCGS